MRAFWRRGKIRISDFSCWQRGILDLLLSRRGSGEIDREIIVKVILIEVHVLMQTAQATCSAHGSFKLALHWVVDRRLLYIAGRVVEVERLLQLWS